MDKIKGNQEFSQLLYENILIFIFTVLPESYILFTTKICLLL